ncbi:hypothetical protein CAUPRSCDRAFT_13178 [Caulochytrium protostelioides]|uniref:Uncharacterized protein n=1 Tax=Caulochytrium protostelioides TaxID=1555241 RepID=A0A4P9WS95_9FUNG|nr:hypothetical protein CAUPRSCDRAFT_13178 [Caulochytrium protostelioides]
MAATAAAVLTALTPTRELPALPAATGGVSAARAVAGHGVDLVALVARIDAVKQLLQGERVVMGRRVEPGRFEAAERAHIIAQEGLETVLHVGRRHDDVAVEGTALARDRKDILKMDDQHRHEPE